MTPETRRWLMFGAMALAVCGGAVVAASDAVGAFWSDILVQVQVLQRDLHRQLSAAMRAVRNDGGAASWALIGLSFLYGVFHAAGPGHGKVVISTYLLTQESEMRRGVVLAFVASLCQGLTAVAAVAATVGVLDMSMRRAQGVAWDLETLSYGLLMLVGLTLLASRTRRLSRRRSSLATHGNGGAHAHVPGHPDSHGEACGDCGHAHGPSLRDLDKPLSWQSLAGMVASVGLRPCSGAILVLLVAYSLDLRLAGVAAVLAMSLGTAITVSTLAVLSVCARRVSLRLAARLPGNAGRLSLAVDIAGMLGGLIILLAGVLLLHAALTAPAHPMM